MPYAAAADIQNEIRGFTVSASTAVTATALDEMLDQESAVIDQYLSTQYETPVTDATALKTLKKICTDFVVYRVRKVLRDNEGLPDNEEVRDVSESAAYREALRLLKSFSDGSLSLNGATRLSGKKKIMGYSPDKAVSTAVFKKDEQQW